MTPPAPFMNYLPESAAAAWQAYTAMETTKQRHITLLSGLENRYGSLAKAQHAETLLLDKLLHDHDVQVRRFTQEMAMLKSADAAAHAALLAYMREINEALARYTSDESGPTQLA